ncbi:hypothetical protein ES702_07030 [subsurface metagenome]
MSKLTTEKITEIRDALQVIRLAINTLSIGEILVKAKPQIERIDKLLPDVNFEERI